MRLSSAWRRILTSVTRGNGGNSSSPGHNAAATSWISSPKPIGTVSTTGSARAVWIRTPGGAAPENRSGALCMTLTRTRTLKIGMIGIGVGGAEILPAMEAMETIDLVAGADVVPETLQRFKERYPRARTYASAQEPCDDPEVEAFWISSPNRFHADHAILAA